MIYLYKKNANGSIQEWGIDYEPQFHIVIRYGQVGGSRQTQRETVPIGLAGRTLKEQVRSRIQSRINKQIDKGYVKTYEEAKTGEVTNALFLPLPQLALAEKRAGEYNKVGSFIQLKLDGNRCIITRQQNKIVAYSRNGKLIDTIDHIIDDIDIPEGTFLDGELYHHGTKLQTIMSWTKRKQENTKKLKYHIFDMMSARPFAERWAEVRSFSLGDNVKYVPTWDTYDSNAPKLQDAIHEGYEGLILRLDGYGYQAGKRNKSLIKIKQFYDNEYQVIGIVASKDGWAILELITPQGKLFRASAPGTMEQKKEVLDHQSKYLNTFVTVQYALLTADNIPFQPVAIRWRDA